MYNKQTIYTYMYKCVWVKTKMLTVNRSQFLWFTYKHNFVAPRSKNGANT